MIIITGTEMRALETSAFQQGADALLLMERAAEGVVRSLFQMEDKPRVLFVCGKGNNGADGLAAARILAREGGQAAVLLMGEMKTPQGQTNLQFLQYLGIPVLHAFPDRTDEYDIIADCLWGTGFHGKPDAAGEDLIERINQSGLKVLSVDVPSGMNADTGECAGACVHADVTVTFHALKTGLYLGPHSGWCGRRILWDIGLKHTEQGLESYTEEDLPRLLKPRPTDAHKGDCGRVLVRAGSEGMAGAAAMCALGALRAGSGLVTICTDRALIPILQTLVPNAMCVPADQAISPPPFDVLAAGCGLGTNEQSRGSLTALLRVSPRAVLDADALNMLAAEPYPIPCPAVLTPHVGEAARLLGASPSDITMDLCGSARAISRKYGCTVLLKSAVSVIADGDRTALNIVGSPSLSKGGSGDALCGILAHCLHICADPFEAARLAALRLGLAGIEGAKRHGVRSLLTGEMLDCLA